MIKRFIISFLSLLPLLNIQAQAPVKIGIINIDAVVQSLPETKEAQAQWDAASAQYESEYNKLNTEFKRLYDDFNNIKSNELPVIKDRKTREFQEYSNKILTFEQDVQNDLNRMQKELMKPIYQKIKDAVDAVGKEGNFDIIQQYNPDQIVYYGSNVIDITPIVKEKLMPAIDDK